MKHLTLVHLIVLSIVTGIVAQSDLPTEPPNPLFMARLSKTLDAKNARVGEDFRAELLDDLQYGSEPRQRVPRGSRLIGHFTEAQPLTKESKESRLGFVFDKAVTKNGAEIELNIAIVGFEAPPPPLPARSIGTIAKNDDPMQRAAGPAADSKGRQATPSTPTLDAGELRADLWRGQNNGQNEGWHALGNSSPTRTAVLISKDRNAKLPRETLVHLMLILPERKQGKTKP